MNRFTLIKFFEVLLIAVLTLNMYGVSITGAYIIDKSGSDTTISPNFDDSDDTIYIAFSTDTDVSYKIIVDYNQDGSYDYNTSSELVETGSLSANTYETVGWSGAYYLLLDRDRGQYAPVVAKNGTYRFQILVMDGSNNSASDTSLTCDVFSGWVTGTVTDEILDTPITFGYVAINQMAGDEMRTMGFTSTSSAGTYIVYGIRGTSYFIQCQANGYGFVMQSFSGASDTGTIMNVTLPPYGAITGNVTDISGNVLTNTKVSYYMDALFGDNNWHTESVDSNGTYSIGLMPGNYDIGVYCSGYGLTKVTGKTINTNETTILDFSLPTAGTVSGTITTSSDTPLENVTVKVYGSQNDYEDDRRIYYSEYGGSSNSPYASSDASGLYSISDLAPGYYIFEFELSGYSKTIKTNVQVTSSITTELNVTLTSGGIITGTLTSDTDGSIITTGTVRLYNNSNVSISDGKPNSSGVYEFKDVTPGTYKLRIEDIPGLAIMEKENNSVTANETTTVNFSLIKGSSVSGVVYKSNGVTPVGGQPMILYPQGTDFTDVENVDIIGQISSSDTGYFVFNNVPAGTYDMAAYSMSPNGIEIQGSKSSIGVTTGNNVTGADFNLKGDSGVISGYVKTSDSTVIYNADVVLYTGAGVVASVFIKSDVNGRYYIEKIPVDTGYYITVAKDGFTSAIDSPVTVTNASTTPVYFYLNYDDVQAPIISSISPENNSVFATDACTISVTVSDGDGSGINSSSIILRLDGSIVSHSYNSTTKTITYYASNLSEGQHSIELTLADKAGNYFDADGGQSGIQSQTWTFSVDSVAPMVDVSCSYTYVKSYINNQITVTFSEAPAETPSISLDQQGSYDINDSMSISTSNSLVYLYEYYVDVDKHTYEEGWVTISLSDVKDAAGHSPSSITGDTGFYIDLSSPEIDTALSLNNSSLNFNNSGESTNITAALREDSTTLYWTVTVYSFSNNAKKQYLGVGKDISVFWDGSSDNSDTFTTGNFGVQLDIRDDAYNTFDTQSKSGDYVSGTISNLDVTPPVLSVGLSAAASSLNVNTTDSIGFIATFNEDVYWAITITGQTSSASKTLTGHGSSINTYWTGIPASGTLQSEICNVVLTAHDNNNNSYDGSDTTGDEITISFIPDNVGPKVTISYSDTTPESVSAGNLTIVATFDEVPVSTPKISIDRSGSSDINMVSMSGSGTTYTYTYLVYTADGSNYLDGVATVSISNAPDTYGNAATITSGETFVIDTKGPFIDVTYLNNPAKAGTITITATLSETTVSTPKISIYQPGSVDVSSQSMSGSGTSWTYEYTVNDADGNFYIDGVASIDISNVTDDAGNKGQLRSGGSFDIDTTGDTYSISLNKTSPVGQGTLIITITFNTSYESTPLISINQQGTTDVSGAAMTATSDAKVWVYGYTINPHDGSAYIDGDATISLDNAYDLAGNIATTTSSSTFTIDTIAPDTPVITTSSSNVNVASTSLTGTSSASEGSTIKLLRSGSLTSVSTTVDASGNFTFTSISLNKGNNFLSVQAEDIAGNASGVSDTINIYRSGAASYLKLDYDGSAEITSDGTSKKTLYGAIYDMDGYIVKSVSGTITFSISSGYGTLQNGEVAVSDGYSVDTFTAPTKSGTTTIAINYPGLSEKSKDFTIKPQDVYYISVKSEDGGGIANGSGEIVYVRAYDINGNQALDTTVQCIITVSGNAIIHSSSIIGSSTGSDTLYGNVYNDTILVTDTAVEAITITVQSIGLSGTNTSDTITFIGGGAHHFQVYPASPVSVSADAGSYNLTAVLLDADGNTVALATPCTWTVLPAGTTSGTSTTSSGIANYSLTTGTTAGDTFIVSIVAADTSSITGVSAEITVVAGDVATISVTPSSSTSVSADDANVALTATVKDANNNVIATSDMVCTWTISSGASGSSFQSDTSLTNSSGVASNMLTTTTAEDDTFIIMASVNNSTGVSAIITVTEGELNSIDIGTDTTIISGNTVTLTVTGYDRYNNVVTASNTSWSSDSSAITVMSDTSSGQIYAKLVGNAIITATKSTFQDTILFTVTAGDSTRIDIVADTSYILTGDSIIIDCYAYDAEGNKISINPVFTSSNLSAVTIGDSMVGALTGISSGTSIITATLDSFTDTLTVTVLRGSLAGIELSADTTSVVAGNNVTLTTVGYNQNGNPYSLSTPTYYTSDSSSIASFSDSTCNLLTTVSSGTVTITATNNGFADSVVIYLYYGSLTSIKILPEAINIKVGNTGELYAYGYDLNGNTLPVSVTWATDFSSIASLANSSEGIFTGVSGGTATASITYGTLVDTASINVNSGNLGSLEITASTTAILIGASVRLDAKGYDNNNIEMDLSATEWSLSNSSVVEIKDSNVQNIYLTGLAQGSVIITAVDSGISDTFVLTVDTGSLKSITVSGGQSTLQSGETLQLTAAGYNLAGGLIPAEISWASDSTDILSVTAGLVTAKKKGTATITASSGSVNKTVSIEVLPGAVNTITVLPMSDTTIIGNNTDSTMIQIKIYDSNQNLITETTPISATANKCGNISSTLDAVDGIGSVYVKADSPCGIISVVFDTNGVSSDSVEIYVLTVPSVAVKITNPDIGEEITSVEIPANALDTPVTVVISKPDTTQTAIQTATLASYTVFTFNGDLENTIREFSAIDESGVDVFEQNSDLEFNSAVTITLPYPSTVDATRADRLIVFQLVGSKWELVSSDPTLDKTNNKLSFTTKHFSIYRIGELAAPATNLSGVRIYPNPFKPHDGNKVTGSYTTTDALQYPAGIKFDRLPKNVTIDIYNIAGDKVITITESDPIDDYYVWNVENEAGDPVASGIYIAVIKNSDDSNEKPVIKKIGIIK